MIEHAYEGLPHPPACTGPEGEADFSVLTNLLQQIEVFEVKFAFKPP